MENYRVNFYYTVEVEGEDRENAIENAYKEIEEMFGDDNFRFSVQDMAATAEEIGE